MREYLWIILVLFHEVIWMTWKGLNIILKGGLNFVFIAERSQFEKWHAGPPDQQPKTCAKAVSTSLLAVLKEYTFELFWTFSEQ